MVQGGGIRTTEKFDVISIQFAIHYMMNTQERAKRFFQTVSELLDMGGSFIATTVDARVVIEHLLNLGLNFHQEDCKDHGGAGSTEAAVVEVGGGACRLSFPPKTIQWMFRPEQQQVESSSSQQQFGLEYLFQLVEGNNQAAGVGDAVNVPESLLPLLMLQSLAEEVGLEMDYFQNFHDFYSNPGGRRQRKGVATNDPEANGISLLHDMGVLNHNGRLSNEEWEICRLYCAFQFRKVREPTGVVEKVDPEPKLKSVKDRLMPVALMKAKRVAGQNWSVLPKAKKQRLIEIELQKMVPNDSSRT
jgi:mRNA (guanine-N7-)-methyltransferase